ncbi:ribosome biogenesis protein Rrp14-C [Metarhizium album ARSEF 1941]|uniref:Ribosome biogenesis protein Rrp14-C n=1 Tax=Metarhizium album (strain ARSEF 1941) TaxID=1081103 RepID=A0A0B2X6G5_METAS|nr:ribosome biogenesis protein Rrp14-C [Metarhizium album ARSEF 1941]KHO01065.1 ribosome biogenesis protein Rrp14-C [Metarhizium album ARSEF 1941]
MEASSLEHVVKSPPANQHAQDRLRDYSKAFDGLLSLIPAKVYYGGDTSDQWTKKKQTKKEAAAARRGKLDPDSELNRNAKEVMDERAKNKRKLRQMEDQADDDDEDDEEDGSEDGSLEAVDGVETEKPGEGLRRKPEESSKRLKLAEKDEHHGTGPVETAEGASKLSKKDAKREAKREKRAEKKAEKKSLKQNAVETSSRNSDATESTHHKNEVQSEGPWNETKEDAEVASRSESEPHSPTFDTTDPSSSLNDASAEQASTTTSVSSAIPPSEKPRHIKLPADTTALRARLAAKVEALRAARKADGPDGKPIRTRQELIESRRAKQAQRKERKLELRKQARLEEARKREEALASNSPSVMSPAVELDEGGFSFGRVAFGDGSQMSHDLSYMLNQGKKKGPSDAKTALLKVQNQKKRLQELDTEKRADVAEKEAWLTARRRAEGEKIRDDEAMLKKAVKRKESAKKKSEKAWTERAKGVQQAQKERQKKREENIKQRREEKLLGKAGKKKGGAKKKKGGRPGFEGSFGVGGRRK